MYNYSTLRNKRIIILKSLNSHKTKRIKERTFIGVKIKNDSLVQFGRLELILDSTILLTTLKQKDDSLIIPNSNSTLKAQDTLVIRSTDYDTSCFIPMNQIQSVYVSTNNQTIKIEVALLLLSTGMELIVIPPVIGLLVAGTLKGLISSGVIYLTISGIPMTLWSYLKYRNIGNFKEYDITNNWRIKLKKK